MAAGNTTVDTGGEFPSGADQPEPGQDGSPKQAESRVSGDPGEFATSVTVYTAGEFTWGVRGCELLIPWGAQLAQSPADRRRAAIRQQYPPVFRIALRFLCQLLIVLGNNA